MRRNGGATDTDVWVQMCSETTTCSGQTVIDPGGPGGPGSPGGVCCPDEPQLSLSAFFVVGSVPPFPSLLLWWKHLQLHLPQPIRSSDHWRLEERR